MPTPEVGADCCTRHAPCTAHLAWRCIDCMRHDAVEWYGYCGHGRRLSPEAVDAAAWRACGCPDCSSCPLTWPPLSPSGDR